MAKKKEWHPLDLASLMNCRFLACDPSLAGTGIIYMEVHEGQVYVLGAERLATAQTEALGWDDTFQRFTLLQALLNSIVSEWVDDFGDTDLRAVHEAPPVAWKQSMRIESTILAGAAFRNTALNNYLVMEPSVTPQSHKKLICGNHIADKKIHHNSIRELLPKIHEGRLISNEALRDALSVGLYAIWRRTTNS